MGNIRSFSVAAIPWARAAGIALLVITLATGAVGCSNGGNRVSAASGHQVALTVEGHGVASLTWSGAAAGTAPRATLPWHLTVPSGSASGEVRLTVELDGRGGQATCAIVVDGRRLVSSLASGAYGRAVCTASRPSVSQQRADA